MRFVALLISLILGVKVLHLIVVTQAQVLCLICTPEARGLRVYISGQSTSDCYNYYVTLSYCEYIYGMVCKFRL